MSAHATWPRNLLLMPSQGRFAECNRGRMYPHIAKSVIAEKLTQVLAKWLPPVIDVRIEAKRGPTHVDFAIIDWRCKTKLLIEADGYEWHKNKAQFRADRMRDAYALIDGWMTMRFSGTDINERPDVCGAMITEFMLRSWANDNQKILIKSLKEEHERFHVFMEALRPLFENLPPESRAEFEKEWSEMPRESWSAFERRLWINIWTKWHGSHSGILKANLMHGEISCGACSKVAA